MRRPPSVCNAERARIRIQRHNFEFPNLLRDRNHMVI